MTERPDRPSKLTALHAEAERIAVPNMDLVITTLEGMVDAVEALGRRGAHPWHHGHKGERPHQTGS